MALAINDFESPESGGRDRLSRVLGVAAVLYGLIAAITGVVAVAGQLGLAGLVADPAALAPARMLGLPWSLAAGGGPTASLLITLGALGVNLVILLAGARLVRPRIAKA